MSTTFDDDAKAAAALGASVLTRIKDPSVREVAIRNALTAASTSSLTVQGSWRCFHCDENFTSEREARLHFGATEDSTPACRIAGAEHSLLQELRRVENELADLWFSVHNESTEAAKAYLSQNGRHQRQLVVAEELGYERGLRDAKAECAND